VREYAQALAQRRLSGEKKSRKSRTIHARFETESSGEAEQRDFGVAMGTHDVAPALLKVNIMIFSYRACAAAPDPLAVASAAALRLAPAHAAAV
jgi:hypothetical protein